MTTKLNPPKPALIAKKSLSLPNYHSTRLAALAAVSSLSLNPFAETQENDNEEDAKEIGKKITYIWLKCQNPKNNEEYDTLFCSPSSLSLSSLSTDIDDAYRWVLLSIRITYYAITLLLYHNNDINYNNEQLQEQQQQQQSSIEKRREILSISEAIIYGILSSYYQYHYYPKTNNAHTQKTQQNNNINNNNNTNNEKVKDFIIMTINDLSQVIVSTSIFKSNNKKNYIINCINKKIYELCILYFDIDHFNYNNLPPLPNTSTIDNAASASLPPTNNDYNNDKNNRLLTIKQRQRNKSQTEIIKIQQNNCLKKELEDLSDIVNTYNINNAISNNIAATATNTNVTTSSSPTFDPFCINDDNENNNENNNKINDILNPSYPQLSQVDILNDLFQNQLLSNTTNITTSSQNNNLKIINNDNYNIKERINILSKTTTQHPFNEIHDNKGVIVSSTTAKNKNNQLNNNIINNCSSNKKQLMKEQEIDFKTFVKKVELIENILDIEKNKSELEQRIIRIRKLRFRNKNNRENNINRSRITHTQHNRLPPSYKKNNNNSGDDNVDQDNRFINATITKIQKLSDFDVITKEQEEEEKKDKELDSNNNTLIHMVKKDEEINDIDSNLNNHDIILHQKQLYEKELQQRSLLAIKKDETYRTLSKGSLSSTSSFSSNTIITTTTASNSSNSSSNASCESQTTTSSSISQQNNDTIITYHISKQNDKKIYGSNFVQGEENGEKKHMNKTTFLLHEDSVVEAVCLILDKNDNKNDTKNHSNNDKRLTRTLKGRTTNYNNKKNKKKNDKKIHHSNNTAPLLPNVISDFKNKIFVSPSHVINNDNLIQHQDTIDNESLSTPSSSTTISDNKKDYLLLFDKYKQRQQQQLKEDNNHNLFQNNNDNKNNDNTISISSVFNRYDEQSSNSSIANISALTTFTATATNDDDDDDENIVMHDTNNNNDAYALSREQQQYYDEEEKKYEIDDNMMTTDHQYLYGLKNQEEKLSTILNHNDEYNKSNRSLQAQQGSMISFVHTQEQQRNTNRIRNFLFKKKFNTKKKENDERIDEKKLQQCNRQKSLKEIYRIVNTKTFDL